MHGRRKVVGEKEEAITRKGDIIDLTKCGGQRIAVSYVTRSQGGALKGLQGGCETKASFTYFLRMYRRTAHGGVMGGVGLLGPAEQKHDEDKNGQGEGTVEVHRIQRRRRRERLV